MRFDASKRLIVAFCAAGALAATAAGEVVFATTFGGGAFGEKVGLSGVGVERGGDVYAYDMDQMIGVTLGAINLPAAGLRTILLYADPLDNDRHLTMNDAFVNTGLLDCGDGPGEFSSEYIRLDFESPVINDIGADLLVTSIAFDFDDGFQTHPSDYFVSLNGSESSLIQAAGTPEFRLDGVDSIPYYGYQGGVTSPAGLSGPVQHTGGLGNATATSVPTIQSLDLSDLGIAPGASVSSIWMQDSSLNGNSFYPTMVLGLPRIPEPGSALLVLCGALACGARRGR